MSSPQDQNRGEFLPSVLQQWTAGECLPRRLKERQPPASVKAPGEFLPAKQTFERRAEAAQLQATGEFLPAAGGQDESMEPVRSATGSGELLPTQDKAAVQSTTPGEASEPSHSRAPTELCKQEAAPAPGELIPEEAVSSGTQDRSGESLPAKPVRTDTVMTTERPTPFQVHRRSLH